VIQGNAEGMIDGLYPADRAHLTVVLEETKVMARLLQDLQTLSTAEAGALVLHREPTTAGRLADDAVAAFAGAAQEKGVAVGSDVAAGLPELHVDPFRVGEVLTNLLSNALRHTPSGGSVTVAAEPGGNGVAFEVRDTGPGIPPEQLPHVFDRYVKAADTGGSGLGLAIARTLVEAHGGAIEAGNGADGGAIVRFTLPAAPSAD
jgi:signal transduction histidine kinase